MCVLISIKMHKAIKEMVKESPATTVPDSDDKEFESQDQNIELYNKLRGSFRNTDIPLQENNCYETIQSVH